MKKRILTLFLALTMVGTVLCGCGDGSQDNSEGNNGLHQERADANEIVVGIAQDLEDSLDPHMSTSAGTREVLFNIYEGLMKIAPDGGLIPAIAESYEVSPNGTEYTFTLRDGVKFHNGETVRAEDVVYSIERCADTSEGAPLVPAFSNIKRVEAVDEKTVSITIKAADLDFICYMTTAIIPKDYDQLDTMPMGTGPFRFVSRSVQDNIVIERFDDYWGQAASLRKVTYKICEDSTGLLMALNADAIDLCAHLTSSQAMQLGRQYDILEGTMNLVQAVYLNNAAKPFDDVKVRQALSYAINREKIMQFVADGHGTALGSSIYPAFTKYFLPELVDTYPYDPGKAKELLAQAGYPDGFDMTIMVASNNQPHVDTAEVVAEQLKAVGINVKVQLVEWQTWYEQAYQGRDFQATIVGLDAHNVTARDLLERFTSDHAKNFINYSNKEYDSLFQQAIRAKDEAQQVELYQQMERLLSDTAANVYIQDLCDLVAIRSDLTGLMFYPTYVMDLSTLHYGA